jgi:hypothetical protein
MSGSRGQPDLRRLTAWSVAVGELRLAMRTLNAHWQKQFAMS